MTVLHETPGLSSGTVRRYVVGLAMAVLVVGAAFGISRLVADAAGTTPSPLVERSVAMQGQIDALTRAAQAQQSAGARTLEPMVERSLAMEEHFKGDTESNRTGPR